MNNLEFVEKLKLAESSKTLYVSGGFGAPAGAYNNRTRYGSRAEEVATCDADTYFFDCVCLGKGILWGWNATPTARYGGAVYKSNNVPDFSTAAVPNLCGDTYSTDMTPDTMSPGEWLYMKGHVGYYIGNGEVIESTPAWKNRVQITKLTQRKWLGHGKIQYIDYVESEPIHTPTAELICPCCGARFVKA